MSLSLKPRTIDTYSFWWSETRLLIAAMALFLGGVPPIYLLIPPSMYEVTLIGLKIAWIVSGLSAIHLIYRWYHTGQRLFGHKDHKDTLAFLLLILSGLNLGFAGVFGVNLGMSVAGGWLLFLMGILYLLAAYQLMSSFRRNKNRIY
jgi:uncharacterized membrane protein YuzA (DUF378 family)